MMEDLFISRNHVLIDIESPLVSHYRVKHCEKETLSDTRPFARRPGSLRTPEKRAWLHGGCCLQVARYHANGLDCIRTRRVAGEQCMEVGEVRSLESLVDVVNLFGRGLGARYLTIACVVT